MLQNADTIDERLSRALDHVGLVGSHLRERLVKDLKAKIVLRSARDAVEVIGDPGSGKHKVVEAAHAVACEVLGRTGPITIFDCTTHRDGFDAGLTEAIRGAQGGTLVLDRFGTLGGADRSTATRLLRRCEDALVLAVSQRDAVGQDAEGRTATAIHLRPLHDREEDIWELVDHFFEATIEDLGLSDACRGFSRQAKGDIAQVVQATCLRSVRRLQDIVRDVVFETLADGPLPLKLTSEQVRPYLERHFGQTPEDRAQRDADLITSQFEAVIERTLLEDLAQTHEIPEELLARQAQLIHEIAETIHDVPQSYRNILTKVEDVQRAALWLMTGATTQASFRRYFGDEGFMRPTKSVAWAFYNRVFKRDM